MSNDLTTYQGFLDVQSGELLEPGVGSAVRSISSARAMKQHANAIIREVTDYLVSLAEHQGTKTLHGDGETITLSGGTSTDYDPADLRDALEAAGCPEDRINAAVRMEITYKVDRAVLRQLAGANENYRAAIELAERQVEKAYAATISLRRNSDDQ